jgi:hypothetical protein
MIAQNNQNYLNVLSFLNNPNVLSFPNNPNVQNPPIPPNLLKFLIRDSIVVTTCERFK